jgi:hypothetical protein
MEAVAFRSQDDKRDEKDLCGRNPVREVFSRGMRSLQFAHYADCWTRATPQNVLGRPLRYKWIHVHSLYAGMGGFAFDMSLLPQGQDAFVPNVDQLHLSPLGVLLLAKCGCLPNISLREIKDKSKADGLAKTIVCVQAGWMVI